MRTAAHLLLPAALYFISTDVEHSQFISALHIAMHWLKIYMYASGVAVCVMGICFLICMKKLLKMIGCLSRFVFCLALMTKAFLWRKK